MDLLKQAAFLNNKGASLLASGKMSQALTILKGALLKVNEVSKLLMAEERTNSSCELDMALSARFIDVDEEVHQFDLEGHFLWTQPIILSRLPKLCEEYGLQILTSITLFNMALVFHMKHDEKSLRRAFKIYELSMHSFESMADQGAACSAYSIPCLNNQAHIQYVLGEYAQARETSDVLTETITHCLNLDEVNNVNFSDGDIEKMLLNAFWMTGPPLVAAAA